MLVTRFFPRLTRDVHPPVFSQRETKLFGTVLLATACLIGTNTSVLAMGQCGELAFRRIASFPVFLNTDVALETVAEIVAASDDGNLLIYTDSETENVGFVNITTPSNPLPLPADTLPVGGEPTSVAVAGPYALVGVNTSPNFVAPSGLLQIVDLHSRTIIRTIPLGGQPDSVAISPDRRFAAIVIENERDEDLGNGSPPQLPSGFLVIVDLVGPPAQWTTRTVSFDGVADLFPTDAEPEFVDINRANIAAVTLQENNHVLLVHLPSGKIRKAWNAGSVDLEHVDTIENGLIELDGILAGIPREPDAVAWISPSKLATADEGDLEGGNRGFTIFSKNGGVNFTSGNSIEHLVARLGHYPEERSENKGNEPEGVEFGTYRANCQYLFVGSERSSVVVVYTLNPSGRPRLVQVLPAGVGPEGLLAIPQRDLFVAASENDDRGDAIRSIITLYRLEHGSPTYPTIMSANRPDGLPIPWGALSALAADQNDPNRLYTVYDSFYQHTRIFGVNTSQRPALITNEIVLHEGGNPLNLDAEGLAARQGGGFWLVSEGAGSVDDPDRPVTSLNLLLQVAADGTVLNTIELPAATNVRQRRFGLEGVTAVGSGDNELVYVAFQREWVNDPDDQVRIGRYEVATGEWTFFYYPLDTPTSPNGGWVGLSEVVAVDDTTFAVVERDNQGGPDATIKKIYTFSVDGLTPQPEGAAFPLVTKTFVRDLIPDLTADHGPVLEKVEGLTIAADGDTYIVTDNDGVEDSSGETQFLNLGNVFEL